VCSPTGRSDTAEALAGPYEALEAARTFVAWATGFVSMELAGAFRLGATSIERMPTAWTG
jgi:hypothetical protein